MMHQTICTQDILRDTESTIICPHNLCPKAWACIIYKWARGKLFYSTGIIVKSFFLGSITSKRIFLKRGQIKVTPCNKKN
jgi:hypothetical protein